MLKSVILFCMFSIVCVIAQTSDENYRGYYRDATPALPGKGFFLGNGIWHNDPNFKPDPNSRVELKIKLTIKDSRTGNIIRDRDVVHNEYRWGEQTTCNSDCVAEDHGAGTVVYLGQSPASYTLNSYPSTFSIHLSKSGYYDFFKEIPVTYTDIMSPYKMITVFMEPIK